MAKNQGLILRTNAALAVRAKQALQVYTDTGQGLRALSTFMFPGIGSAWGANGTDWSGGGSWGSNWVGVSDTNSYNYNNVNAYNSSIVMACLNWISTAFRAAKPSVYKIKGDGTKQYLPNHPFTQFLRRPNPYYSYNKLFAAALMSYYLAGSGYIFKEKTDNGFGITTALYYIPFYMIQPIPDPNNYISYYRYTINGQSFRIAPNKIIDLRNGLDPYNPLYGRKILQPVLSEIYTDEEAARFVGALVRNMAIPGVVISPDTEKVKVGKEQAEALKATWKEKFGGDNRGEPFIPNFAAKITPLGFNPEQLQFKEVRRLPEERVAGQFLIPPVVVGLGAGLDKSTFSNYEQAVKSAYESCMIPLWEDIAEELNYQLLYEFTGEANNIGFEFDVKNVRALQESQDTIVNRNKALFTINGITRAELRGSTGFVVDEERDNVFLIEIAAANRPPALTPPPNNTNADGGKKSLIQRALGLLKAAPSNDYDNGLEMRQEATVKETIGEMSNDLDEMLKLLSIEAEKEANDNLDIHNPTSEADRILQGIIKAIGLTLIIKAIWGSMGKVVEEDSVTSISLRIGIAEGALWDDTTNNAAKSVLYNTANDYENSLMKQTREAIITAIKGAQNGESIATIAKNIKSAVAGREMYPGVYKSAFDEAKEAGATDEQAARAGESKARRYRAKLIAETETRKYQNLANLEIYQKAGIDKVLVKDGDGCGWKNHEDEDKADGTERSLEQARKYSLAHPNCKRRFYPPKKA
jgi:HK97 family phage portal protein